MNQTQLWSASKTTPPKPLLKWIGNKHRFAAEIISAFPKTYRRYLEPFLGTGAVLGRLAPDKAIGGDVLTPLVEIWHLVQSDPERLSRHYRKCWNAYIKSPKDAYEAIKAKYNKSPNGLDLLFLCRSCYGGVVRFRKNDGYMSTPVGPHRPIPPEAFEKRLYDWRERIRGTEIFNQSFEETMRLARKGDMIYCDPPYFHSQTILYGAQDFQLDALWTAIESCARKGAYVALSIDGMKKSKRKKLHIDFPDGLFKQERLIECGRSMLKRFWRAGEDVRDEEVHDRLLLTW